MQRLQQRVALLDHRIQPGDFRAANAVEGGCVAQRELNGVALGAAVGVAYRRGKLRDAIRQHIAARAARRLVVAAEFGEALAQLGIGVGHRSQLLQGLFALAIPAAALALQGADFTLDRGQARVASQALRSPRGRPLYVLNARLIAGDGGGALLQSVLQRGPLPLLLRDEFQFRERPAQRLALRVFLLLAEPRVALQGGQQGVVLFF